MSPKLSRLLHSPSPQSNSRSSFKNLHSMAQASHQIIKNTEKSGYSNNQKIETLTKQKFQYEFEGKRIPFKIKDIERLASMKAYKSRTRIYVDEMRPRQAEVGTYPLD